MEDYIGKVCPFCKTEIKEGEAVKVCPACGIPHHEGCWVENKGCTTFGCSEQHYEPQGTNISDACPNCGKPLGDGQDFCPYCGTSKSNVKTTNVCGKCGAQLQEGQEFCARCGQKVGLMVDQTVSEKIDQINAATEKKKNKAIIPIVAGAAVVVIIIIFMLVKGSSGPNLEKIYSEYCTSTFATVASDGSYLQIDTNPLDLDDFTDWDAVEAIESINNALEFPASVYQKMLETRSLDGRQSQTINDITVSWTYHPNSGLVVMYEKN